MKQSDRHKVFAKTDGHCAYCGVVLPEKGWHVDHVRPIYRGNDGVNPCFKGRDNVDNALPSCPRCNNWKSVMSVDVFRQEIERQTERLRRDNAAFRLAEDYGQLEVKTKQVVFYFEHLSTDNDARKDG